MIMLKNNQIWYWPKEDKLYLVELADYPSYQEIFKFGDKIMPWYNCTLYNPTFTYNGGYKAINDNLIYIGDL